MPKEARARQFKISVNGKSFVTLPELCMLVHMYSNGSSDELCESDYDNAKKTLQIALDNWKEERLEDKLFDDAVKNLIIATIEESKGVKI